MIIEVDYSNFMDSLAEADRDGSRVRYSAREGLWGYQSECLDELMTWAIQEGIGEPKIGVIGSGLMAGVYGYSLMDQRAVVWVVWEGEVAPLVDGGVRWDVTLSYSSEDRAKYALALQEALVSQGVGTYLLDVARDPRDPIWKIRFRQALFRSHYSVPILGPSYLQREGTQVELQSMVKLMLRLWQETFFHPMICLQDPIAPGMVPAHGGKLPQGEDLSFVWTHVPGLSLDTKPDPLARFFGSLARNTRGIPDLEWVDVLAPRIIAIKGADLGDRWGVELHVKHPALTCYTILTDGAVARYLGVNEPPDDAVQSRNISREVREILARRPGG